MLRAWWREHLSATRVVALVLLVAGFGLVVVAVAAVSGGRSIDPPWVVIVGGTFLSITRGWRHRESGTGIAIARTFAYAAGYLGGALAFIALITVVHPIASANALLVTSAINVLAIGLVLLGIAALLWERDTRRRRVLALWVLGLGLGLGGLAYASQELMLGLFAFIAGFAICLFAVIKDPRVSPDYVGSVRPSLTRSEDIGASR